MFVKNYKWNGFKMPLNMKNINNFTQWKNGSVDMTFARAIKHQKHLAQSGRCTPSAVDIFNTLRVFTEEPFREQNLSWSVWMCFKMLTILVRNCIFQMSKVSSFWLLSYFNFNYVLWLCSESNFERKNNKNRQYILRLIICKIQMNKCSPYKSNMGNLGVGAKFGCSFLRPAPLLGLSPKS